MEDFLCWLDDANNIWKPTDLEGIIISEWANSFLTTRGVNTLEGNLSEDSIKITQIVNEDSDGLRKQKVDILFLDKDLNQSFYSVITSEDNWDTLLSVKDFKGVWILNYGDHAYAKILLNNETLSFLDKRMTILKDSLTRSLVWKAIKTMIKYCKMKSTDYFKFLQNNIFDETEAYLVDIELSTAKSIVDHYIPDENFEEICFEMFESIYKAILKWDKPDHLSILLDSLFNFLHCQSQIEIAIKWFEIGYVLDGDSKIKGTDLKLNHKFLIVKAVYSKPSFSIEEK